MKNILVLIILCLQITMKAQGLLTNLEACYPMDCDNGLNSAATGPPLNGVLYNIACVQGHGLIASTAFGFNGTPQSYIQLPNSPLLKPQSITVSGWYKTSNNMLPQYLVFTKRPTGSNQAGFEAYTLGIVNPLNTGGQFVARIITNNISGVDVVHPLQISSNTWYHVVFHIDNTIVKLYVNGVLASLSNNQSLIYDSTKGVILGGTNETQFNAPFVGSMDNVRFYDRDLTTAEVNDLYLNDPNCSSAGAGVSPPIACCLGNYCSASHNALTGDYKIPMSGFNFNFTTPLNTGAKVLIGGNSCFNGSARLFVSDDNIGNGIFGRCATTNGNNIAVRGEAGDPNSSVSSNIFGVLGEANLSTTNLSGNSAGVAGFCGGMNSALMPLGENIGVYGNSISNGGKWAGYFDGDIAVNGNGWINSAWMWSDKRFKTNVKKLENVSERLKKLNGYTYTFKTEEFKERNFDKREHIGFIAQELREVFPQLVNEDSKGFLAVNYEGMVPVLIEATKEQQAQIENHEAQISSQQQQINELKTLVQSLAISSGRSAGNSTSLAVTLGDKNTIVLNQNVPNPFAESTVITFYIPTDFVNASIIFTTNDGIVIKTVSILEKGQGSLTVFANDLTHGVYTYSLVVDGKTIATKKMIKE